MTRRNQKVQRKKKKKAAVAVLLIIGSILIAVCLLVFAFRLRKTDIINNHYCSDEEITDWISDDKLMQNTLYLLWKCNREDTIFPPSVESISVHLRSPWEAVISVTEKQFIGRIDFGNSSLYFDINGLAAYQTEEQLEGIPYIEGMSVDLGKVQLGEKLPVSDEKVFENISLAAVEMQKYTLIPDKISCEGSGLTLYFGEIRASIGSGGYESKIAQIPPILQKMWELYGTESGVLHLENYDKSDAAIRFEPDSNTEEEKEEGSDGSKKPGESANGDSAGYTDEDGDGIPDEWGSGYTDWNGDGINDSDSWGTSDSADTTGTDYWSQYGYTDADGDGIPDEWGGGTSDTDSWGTGNTNGTGTDWSQYGYTDLDGDGIPDEWG